MLRRVCLSLIKKGQWRKKWVADSIFWPQLHKGFIVSWKLCLNLCSLKWLRPSLSLVISLIPLGLRISKTEFGEGRMKLSIFSLKTEILLEFLRLGSKLFHSIIADGKKGVLKNLYFVLIRGILLSVLVAYDVHLTRMRWKRYFGCLFLKTYERDKVSCTNNEVGGTQGLILGRFFLSTYLEKFVWLLNRHYIEWTSFLPGKNY